MKIDDYKNWRMIAIEGLSSTSHALFFLQEVKMEQLLSKILEKIKKDAYLFRTWEDLLYMCKEAMKTDIPLGVKYLKLLSAECERNISDPLTSEQEGRNSKK